jgi:hypothetical protein
MRYLHIQLLSGLYEVGCDLGSAIWIVVNHE